MLYLTHCDIVEEKKLDILINNAGAMWIPERKTVDGYESIFATNHLGTMKCASGSTAVNPTTFDLFCYFSLCLWWYILDDHRDNDNDDLNSYNDQ